MRRLSSMNETNNLNLRQKMIINLLSEHAELSRVELDQKIAKITPVSKATLARDIAKLIKLSKIKRVGNGPLVTYTAFVDNPLLKPIDLKQYFILETDQRHVRYPVFNTKIIDSFSGLISPDENRDLKINFRSFISKSKSQNSPVWQKELERFVIDLSWKSSKIEGNTYTLLETEALIKDSQEAAGHSKDEAVMILNHKDAFKAIVSHPDDSRYLSESLIAQLHNTLIKNLNVETGIRSHAVGITGTNYMPLDNRWQIKEALLKIIDKVNSLKHPLEKAITILGMIAYLQPFADGNKRTARMLANAVLIAHDYFPLSYRSIDEIEYKEALIVFYETNNLFNLKRLFLDQYRFALNTYFK